LLGSFFGNPSAMTTQPGTYRCRPLAIFEVTSFDEHVEADAAHASIAANDMAGRSSDPGQPSAPPRFAADAS
jgi:hypothetical protein